MSEYSECTTGWCGTRVRRFLHRPPLICYNKPPTTLVNRTACDEQRFNCLSGAKTQVVPKKSAKAWTMEPGELCRITVTEGSQVGDINMWNRDNPAEHFYSGKTRQFHAAHLTTYDRLWSNLPKLRAMATVVRDSLSKYGIDEDGASCHDVIGTRCDNYSIQLITGQPTTFSCHQALTEAVKEFGLLENDVHDVWNIFMCTGFTAKTHQYFCKASPAEKGDYIEFIADMRLLVALSACPQGDVSTPVGQIVPEEKCHPLGVEVYTSSLPNVIYS